MFKDWLYNVTRFYVKTGLNLFYKKIDVQGLENIPKNGAVLFVANHQNAMMDPILIATNIPRKLYFLARASAFKNKIAGKLLNAIHAIAIYRVRDGVDSKKLNEAVFKQCNNLLNDNKSILIFPEGSHSYLRKVRSLRAGFVRITLDYLEKNPNKEFHIIPIGMNYSNTINYAKEIKIIYDKPILASQFYDKNDLNKSKDTLIDEVYKKLKEITVHVENEKNHDAIISTISEKEFLTPKITNNKIQNLGKSNSKFSPETSGQNSKPKNFFYYLMQLNSVIPILFWKWLKPKVKQVEFTSTAKFSLGLTIFPLIYLLQTLLVNYFFGNYYAILYVFLCFLTVFFSTKTR